MIPSPKSYIINTINIIQYNVCIPVAQRTENGAYNTKSRVYFPENARADQ